MTHLNFKYQKTVQFSQNQIASDLEKINSLILKIKEELKNGYESDYAFAHVPFDEKNIKIINDLALKKKKLKPTSLIVVGIGGSNLGAMAIHEAINGKFYNQFTKDLKIYFADTVDSDYISKIYDFAQNELQENRNIIINLISKSGSTIESIANFEIFLSLLKKYRPNNFHEYIVITTNKKNDLWNFAKQIECDILEIPQKIGGRYSIFTNVGLFPLKILGINIEMLMEGAKEIVNDQFKNENHAAISASLLYQHYINKINIHDTFLFSVDCENIGKWYRQLMAESLGKNSKGLTPTVSIGSTDLHSLFQLNIDGPNDKFTTFVTMDKTKNDLQIPDFREFEKIVANIQKLKFSELMQAIFNAVQKEYQKNKRPFCIINLKDKSEKTLGEFLQFKMFEIVYLSHLMEINPFDQPAVELYKAQTRQILAKNK